MSEPTRKDLLLLLETLHKELEQADPNDTYTITCEINAIEEILETLDEDSHEN